MTEEASFVYSKCIWLFGELVQLLVNFADLLVSLVHLLVNFADLLVSLTEFNPIIMKRCKALLSG